MKLRMFDYYEIRARYFPTIIAALPMVILSAFVKQEVWLTCFQNVAWFLPIENISVSLVFITLLINVQRGIAKHLFEAHIFNSGKDFPTTTLLLHSDQYLSQQTKNVYRQKIELEFNLRLLSKVDEATDPDEAKKTIRDAINLVRKRVGNGDKTRQYNIHYGFARNLIGGAVLAIPVSLLVITVAIFQDNTAALIIGTTLTIAFTGLTVFSKQILTQLGRAYANCLLTEFLTTKGAPHD